MISDPTDREDRDRSREPHPTAERLGDGFSPPAAQQQRPLGDTDVFAMAADAGPALGSQSAF